MRTPDNINLNKNPNKKTLEEKILSHSNSVLYLYQSISDLYTTDSNNTKNELNSMIFYTHVHSIFTLINKSQNSMAVEILQISIKEILESKDFVDESELSKNEIIHNILTLIMNLMEYDLYSCFDFLSIIFSSNLIQKDYLIVKN